MWLAGAGRPHLGLHALGGARAPRAALALGRPRQRRARLLGQFGAVRAALGRLLARARGLPLRVHVLRLALRRMGLLQSPSSLSTKTIESLALRAMQHGHPAPHPAAMPGLRRWHSQARRPGPGRARRRAAAP